MMLEGKNLTPVVTGCGVTPPRPQIATTHSGMASLGYVPDFCVQDESVKVI